MSRPPVRVVVAQPSGLLRAATVRVLEDAGIEVVAEAGDAADLLRKLRAHRPDVAVVDARCPGDLERVRAEVPGMLLFGEHADRRLVEALLAGGAAGAGYLLEPRVAEVSRFTEAIRRVAAGGSVLDPEIVGLVLARKEREQVLDGLNRRDREVLAQMAAGASNRAIAARLFLSERAVERHVTGIFDTFGITAGRRANRRVLAVLAYLRVA